MPHPFMCHLRLCRRPAVMVAAALLLVQAFFTGLTVAQAAGAMAVGGADFAVICHGKGAAVSDPPTVPGSPSKPHACCDSCTAGPAPALLPLAGLVQHVAHSRPAASPAWHTVSIPLAARAVRAGPSQAPPSLD